MRLGASISLPVRCHNRHLLHHVSAHPLPKCDRVGLRHCGHAMRVTPRIGISVGLNSFNGSLAAMTPPPKKIRGSHPAITQNNSLRRTGLAATSLWTDLAQRQDQKCVIESRICLFTYTKQITFTATYKILSKLYRKVNRHHLLPIPLCQRAGRTPFMYEEWMNLIFTCLQTT
jgi:hypothetical protein